MNSRKFFAIPKDDLVTPCRKRSMSSSSAAQPEDLGGDGSCNCTEAVGELTDDVALLTKRSIAPLSSRKTLPFH